MRLWSHRRDGSLLARHSELEAQKKRVEQLARQNDELEARCRAAETAEVWRTSLNFLKNALNGSLGLWRTQARERIELAALQAQYDDELRALLASAEAAELEAQVSLLSRFATTRSAN